MKKYKLSLICATGVIALTSTSWSSGTGGDLPLGLFGGSSYNPFNWFRSSSSAPTQNHLAPIPSVEENEETEFECLHSELAGNSEFPENDSLRNPSSISNSREEKRETREYTGEFQVFEEEESALQPSEPLQSLPEEKEEKSERLEVQSVEPSTDELTTSPTHKKEEKPQGINSGENSENYKAKESTALELEQKKEEEFQEPMGPTRVSYPLSYGFPYQNFLNLPQQISFSMACYLLKNKPEIAKTDPKTETVTNHQKVQEKIKEMQKKRSKKR